MKNLIEKNRQICDMISRMHRNLSVVFDEWIFELEHLAVSLRKDIPEINQVRSLRSNLEEVLNNCYSENIENYSFNYPDNFSDDFEETLQKVYKTYYETVNTIYYIRDNITSITKNKNINLKMPDFEVNESLLLMTAHQMEMYLESINRYLIEYRQSIELYGTSL